MVSRQPEYTYQNNMQMGRHGWLRLTPAYSAKAVHDILATQSNAKQVLDPFSGSGTTGLVCAERGVASTLLDINPFLIWLARAKTAHYTADDLALAEEYHTQIILALNTPLPIWYPPISHIERWWEEAILYQLGQIYAALQNVTPEESAAKDILLVAFCRLVMIWSNADFNHQSVSFKPRLGLIDNILFLRNDFSNLVATFINDARANLAAPVKVLQADSRAIPAGQIFDLVITSPPYPNRMSYIRELRPYMYWLGYLTEARQAGELDWQAIGGTWGIATSRLQQWQPAVEIPYPQFSNLIGAIAENSQPLANYVYKYFEDITYHLQSLVQSLSSGAKVFYIVGNSKFYETLVPVEKIYAALLEVNSFQEVEIKILRKRNSKKELFEYIVTGEKS